MRINFKRFFEKSRSGDLLERIPELAAAESHLNGLSVVLPPRREAKFQL